MQSRLRQKCVFEMTTQYVLLEQFSQKHFKHKDSRVKVGVFVLGFPRASTPSLLASSTSTGVHPPSQALGPWFSGKVHRRVSPGLSVLISVVLRERENRSCSLQPTPKRQGSHQVINLPLKLLCISPDLYPQPSSLVCHQIL